MGHMEALYRLVGIIPAGKRTLPEWERRRVRAMTLM